MPKLQHLESGHVVLSLGVGNEIDQARSVACRA